MIILANSEGPDEMLHSAAFHQGLHCLPNYSSTVHKGLSTSNYIWVNINTLLILINL